MPQEILQNQPFLPIEIPGGVKVAVENDLTQMSSYILLEQEDWFEDEMSFIRRYIRSGMHILDIGANHGVYGLTIASKLGDAGHVWCIEPASEPGAMILEGIRANGLENKVTLLPIALSNREGQAVLNLGGSSELNTLQDEGSHSGRTETIELRTLDSLLKVLCDIEIDFIKLDAEGEEVNVLNGGTQFFEKFSPVVMFELKHGSHVNFNLLQNFAELGMGCYYLVPSLGALVPVMDPSKVDGYTLNLFAMRADRAAQMAEEGFLLSTADFGASPSMPECREGVIEALVARPYCRYFRDAWMTFLNGTELNSSLESYLNGLRDLITFENAEEGLQERYQSGLRARATFENLVKSEGADARVLLAYIRLLNGLGERALAIKTVMQNGAVFKGMRPDLLNRPFMLPLKSQDDLEVKASPSLFIEARVQEFLERRRSFSSFFNSDVTLLSQIFRNPERSIETDRRVALKFLSTGKRVKVKEESWLTKEGQGDHRNVWFWKAWADAEIVQPIKPKVYLIAGMHRSGSTWLYNAVRLILTAWPETKGAVAGGWISDWQRIVKSAPYVVVKTHGYQAAWVQKADYVFYSYRDIRDAMASFRRKFGLQDPLALAMISIQNDRALRRVSNYNMRYEQMIESKLLVLRGICESMGIEGIPDEKLRNIADEIDGMSYDSEGPKNERFHLINLLHKGHITNGGHGSWEKDIPPPVIREMERRHEGWLRENNYIS